MESTSSRAPSSPYPADGSGRMFDHIALRYDGLNRLLSGGLDLWWRRCMIKALQLPSKGRLLDVATGTADVALAMHRAAPQCQIVGVDPSPAMLALGRKKCARAQAGQVIDLQLGDGQQLPFADGTFDRVAIAFGLRNIPQRQLAMAEMVRVLRPKGRLVILELSEPKQGWLGAIGRWYIHAVMPRLAAWWSGAAAYRYLAQSIAAFPPATQVCQMMVQAGLEDVAAHPLTFGTVHLYDGCRPDSNPSSRPSTSSP